jgi:hypothetical protein
MNARIGSTAAAHWALLLITRTLFNDAVTVALWIGFHVASLWIPLRSCLCANVGSRWQTACLD